MTERRTSAIVASHFANTICISVNGLVINKSSVPAFFSSANIRMVIAEIRKINITGDIINSGSSVA